MQLSAIPRSTLTLKDFLFYVHEQQNLFICKISNLSWFRSLIWEGESHVKYTKPPVNKFLQSPRGEKAGSGERVGSWLWPWPAGGGRQDSSQSLHKAASRRWEPQGRIQGSKQKVKNSVWWKSGRGSRDEKAWLPPGDLLLTLEWL